MGIFKKNKSKENADEDVKNVNRARYKVHIYEKLSGNMPRFIKTIDADRWVDQQDFIPYLKNETENFMEVFPQKESYPVNYSKNELENQLKEKEKEWKKEKDKEHPTVNFKDVEYDIMKLKARIRSLKTSPDAVTSSLGRNNIPEFIMLREGSTFHPMSWDLDTSTIQTTNDNKKKSANLALRNKENKYNTEDNKVKTASWVLLAMGVILILGNLFVGWKNLQTYSDQEINQLKSEQIAQINKITENLRRGAGAMTDSAINMQNLTSNIQINSENDTSPPQQRNDESQRNFN